MMSMKDKPPTIEPILMPRIDPFFSPSSDDEVVMQRDKSAPRHKRNKTVGRPIVISETDLRAALNKAHSQREMQEEPNFFLPQGITDEDSCETDSQIEIESDNSNNGMNNSYGYNYSLSDEGGSLWNNGVPRWSFDAFSPPGTPRKFIRAATDDERLTSQAYKARSASLGDPLEKPLHRNPADLLRSPERDKSKLSGMSANSPTFISSRLSANAPIFSLRNASNALNAGSLPSSLNRTTYKQQTSTEYVTSKPTSLRYRGERKTWKVGGGSQEFYQQRRQVKVKPNVQESDSSSALSTAAENSSANPSDVESDVIVENIQVTRETEIQKDKVQSIDVSNANTNGPNHPIVNPVNPSLENKSVEKVKSGSPTVGGVGSTVGRRGHARVPTKTEEDIGQAAANLLAEIANFTQVDLVPSPKRSEPINPIPSKENNHNTLPPLPINTNTYTSSLFPPKANEMKEGREGHATTDLFLDHRKTKKKTKNRKREENHAREKRNYNETSSDAVSEDQQIQNRVEDVPRMSPHTPKQKKKKKVASDDVEEVERDMDEMNASDTEDSDLSARSEYSPLSPLYNAFTLIYLSLFTLLYMYMFTSALPPDQSGDWTKSMIRYVIPAVILYLCILWFYIRFTAKYWFSA
ncbi:hypothetical protein PROFUN_07991 [Planoprotostelium fungivorum]|uniref:Uncharacterized protein n=1 Tax=Planoprotostelium fungivorum TaxID=1890364 RepID=A0A2P6MV98_9EUKA|nr:hypothetical protein PROFUN_07991 [Planoprotostelium fungivorum]